MSPFVQDIGYRRVAVGQSVTIFGGLLDIGCHVYIGDEEASIVDFGEDFIEALAPLYEGDYDVRVTYGTTSVSAGRIHVSALAESPTRNVAKEYRDRDFDEYVRSLFPRGQAFAMWKGSNLSRLITALAFAFAYVWNVILEMLKAIDPTHTENYDEWEKELALPVTGIDSQLAKDRLSEIYRAECLNGGCTKSFYRQLLFLMGIDADVYEYTIEPDKFEGNTFRGDPRYYFKIVFHVKSTDFVQFRAGESAAGDYLLDFTQYREEKVFESIKQSHTKLMFGYDDGIVTGYLKDNVGNQLTDNSGDPLTYERHKW